MITAVKKIKTEDEEELTMSWKCPHCEFATCCHNRSVIAH